MSEQQANPESVPTVTFYWLATIVADRGKQLTCDSTISVAPGLHTRMSTVRAVMDFLREKHGDFVLLYLYLEPNEISALPCPAVTT